MKKGLAAALLCVLWFLSGCSRRQSVVQSGLETESVFIAAQFQTESIQEYEGLHQTKQPDSSSKETESENMHGYVYVCGAVCSPGVYPAETDMRVFEAIALAGGFSDEADEQWLNLAEPVVDGQRIYVYTLDETKALEEKGIQMSDKTADSVETKHSGRIDLNTASKDELMTIPGIGESKADAIILYRTECGGFQKPEDIMEISGIKEAVFAKIKDYITVQ